MTSLLMLNHVGSASGPIVDRLTRKMTAAFHNARPGTIWRGVHICDCGALSDNRDWWVLSPEGIWVLTNSLCVHYLAFHRWAVPAEVLDRIDLWEAQEEPTEEDLVPPPARRFW